MKSALLAASALAAMLTACASAPATPEAPLTPYTCNGDPTNLMVDYYSHSNPRAILHIGDKTTTLYPAPSNSGTRYTTGRTNPNEVLQQTDKPGTLILWTKGSEAMLYKIEKRADGTTYESQLANCTSNPQPLPTGPASLPVPNPLPGTIPGTAPGVIYAPQSTVTL